MVTSRQRVRSNVILIEFIFLLPVMSLAYESCRILAKDNHGFDSIRCACSNPNEDMEVTPELSMSFINASALEITSCRNVIMHSNLFRRSYELHTLVISQLDKLSFDPALSLPVSLLSLSLSEIGILDHFPVPGPSSALLHSVKALELFSLKDITITAPPNTSTSSFIDLPITRVHMHGVKFVGNLPVGSLKFNATSLAHFTATKCQFGEMFEGSFYIHASGNVTIDSCKFKPMERESMKIHGQCIVLSNNEFENLGGTHTIAIQGSLHVSVIKNAFKTLSAPHAMLLSANDNAFVYIKDNQLPCGCYADNFIPAASAKLNHSTCKAEDSLVCALKEKQFCHHSNGKNETIVISTAELPSCPVLEAVPSSSGKDRWGLTLVIWLIFFIFMPLV